MKAGAKQNETGKEWGAGGEEPQGAPERSSQPCKGPGAVGAPLGAGRGHRTRRAGALGEMGATGGCGERRDRRAFPIKGKTSGVCYAQKPTLSAPAPPTPWLSRGPNLHAYLSPWTVPEAWGRGSPGSWLTRGEAGEAVPTAPHPQGAPTWPHTVTCFGGLRAGTNKFTPQDSPLRVHLGPSHGWQAG